jgi:hypothetical protein
MTLDFKQKLGIACIVLSIIFAFYYSKPSSVVGVEEHMSDPTCPSGTVFNKEMGKCIDVPVATAVPIPTTASIPPTSVPAQAVPQYTGAVATFPATTPTIPPTALALPSAAPTNVQPKMPEKFTLQGASPY